jgi:RNase P/RNase MRP subunit p29
MLIGKKAEIHYNSHNFKGMIVNETKNTIQIKTQQGIKTLLKQASIIKINNKTVKGKDIIIRPQDRLKK